MNDSDPKEILQLYPPPVIPHALRGLYLGHDLRRQTDPDAPFVYSNYITSLDGRISIPNEEGEQIVPKNVQNERDWRLFQELAVQADLLFTSGRYLRNYVNGNVQEILQVYEDPRFSDLGEWRTDHGLPPRPDLAVISRSADFPIPEALQSGERRVIVVTTHSAPRENLEALEGHAEVIIAGETGVDGGVMITALHEMGYRLMYNATGPQVLHLLIRAGCLDRLYLTQTGRLLGGLEYSTIVEGELLPVPENFTLARLYFDPAALEGIGQVFSVYERRG